MILSELVRQINSLADENESIQDVTAWINDAIARINIELDAEFPFLDATQTDEEPAFSETWQRAVVIPFGVGRVKQKDSSQFEYSDAYNEFISALMEMKAKYNVPEEYRSASNTSSFTMDLSRNMYSWTGDW